ncbi:MAG: YciI family protein [Cocleimonas sp.]|nr:YciI family protein [Cocleimonas sp.]
MLYAIISEDIENSLDKRLSVRPLHLERLQQLKSQGRLILAGPHPSIDNEEAGSAGFSGSLIVAEFSSLLTAQQWADADPYVEAGVYVKVTVKPFKKVLP